MPRVLSLAWLRLWPLRNRQPTWSYGSSEKRSIPIATFLGGDAVAVAVGCVEYSKTHRAAWCVFEYSTHPTRFATSGMELHFQIRHRLAVLADEAKTTGPTKLFIDDLEDYDIHPVIQGDILGAILILAG